MTDCVYQYRFAQSVLAEDVEASLLLAIFAVESLHGEAAARLDVAHRFDPETRVCVLDAGTPAGRDLNRIFVGFLRREYGAGSFTVWRVSAPQGTTAA
jgi:hypothetical protein